MGTAPENTQIRITTGFHPDEAGQIAQLFWQAFHDKLGMTLAPEEKAISFITAALNPEYALVARDDQGQILGVAGLKVGKAGMMACGLRDLAAVYGWAGALWRAVPLALLERDLAEDELMIDGLFVSADARGLGVGTALVRAVKTMARDKGFRSIQLEVVDTNPRAQALYERERFVPNGQQYLGPLRHIFGFRSATQMIWVNTAARQTDV